MKKNIKNKDNTIVDYLNPDYIYIPYDDKFDKLLVNIGDDVCKNQDISIHNNIIMTSSVSGKLIGTTDSMYINNKKSTSLVIENDFKENVYKKIFSKKYINEYSKEELIKLLNKYYKGIEINDNAKTLIINGIDLDAYEKTYSFLINQYTPKILETIDAISTIFEINNVIFAVSTHDNFNVVSLTNNIGTYPNIKLKYMQYFYPIGYKDVLINHVLNKKEKKENYIYLTVKDVYNIYNILKRKQPINETMIYISGNCLESEKVVRVKVGTSLNDIIKNTCEVTNRGYYVVVNGLISGSTIISLNTPISNDIRSIFLNTKDEEIEKKCINCGLCNKKCPVGLNPKYIMEHKHADRSKCIKCGLCSYICPSKINFKPYLGGKDE